VQAGCGPTSNILFHPPPLFCEYPFFLLNHPQPELHPQIKGQGIPLVVLHWSTSLRFCAFNRGFGFFSILIFYQRMGQHGHKRFFSCLERVGIYFLWTPTSLSPLLGLIFPPRFFVYCSPVVYPNFLFGVTGFFSKKDWNPGQSLSVSWCFFAYWGGGSSPPGNCDVAWRVSLIGFYHLMIPGKLQKLHMLYLGFLEREGPGLSHNLQQNIRTHLMGKNLDSTPHEDITPRESFLGNPQLVHRRVCIFFGCVPQGGDSNNP